MQKTIYIPHHRYHEVIWLPKQRYFYIGLIFLLAYLLQDILNLHWHWLMNLQTGESFKRWSGLLLAMYIGSQWALSAFRITRKGKAAKWSYTFHNQAGAAAPFFFYTHAMELGYAYLFVLSLVYYSNMVVGLFNPTVLNNRNASFAFYWMIVHVTLSVLVVVFAIYHIFIVFYYQ